MSNMTVVEFDDGVTVIDPLITAECAAAAIGLPQARGTGRPPRSPTVTPIWILSVVCPGSRGGHRGSDHHRR